VGSAHPRSSWQLVPGSMKRATVRPMTVRLYEIDVPASEIAYVTPNVRAKLPAEACSVSLVCEGAEGAAHQAYAACRSGSA
jgi:hypothetical protein